MIVSPDAYLYDESGRYVWSPDRVKAAWRKAMGSLDRYLQGDRFSKVVLMVGIPASGKSTWLQANHDADGLYFDATFTGVRQRQPVIEAAKRAGKRVEAVIMDTPIGVCFDRNKCRPPDRQVPDDIVINMAVRLTEQPPTKAEGFDDVRTVKSGTSTARRVMARYYEQLVDSVPEKTASYLGQRLLSQEERDILLETHNGGYVQDLVAYNKHGKRRMTVLPITFRLLREKGLLRRDLDDETKFYPRVDRARKLWGLSW
jgi:predicted kinase